MFFFRGENLFLLIKIINYLKKYNRETVRLNKQTFSMYHSGVYIVENGVFVLLALCVLSVLFSSPLIAVFQLCDFYEYLFVLFYIYFVKMEIDKRLPSLSLSHLFAKMTEKFGEEKIFTRKTSFIFFVSYYFDVIYFYYL